MRKFFLKSSACLALVAGVALLFTSCKEKGVLINMGGGPAANETTGVGPVETPQPRIVLFEEFTGVSCPPCPKAHVILKQIRDANPNRTAMIGIQVFGFNQAYPVVEKGDTLTKYDNRTEAGTALSLEIFGKVNQTPASGIDRVPENSSLYLIKDLWTARLATRLAVPTLANVSVISNYDAASQLATIRVRVSYTGNVNKKQKLTLALIENHVVDAQEDGLTINEDYDHEHVLRDILTQPSGDAMLGAFPSIEPGRFYERTFVYDMSQHPLWNVDNCKLVAYVSNAEAGDKEVLQAAEVSLK